MSSKAMSLKGRIKNYAKSNNIAAQVVLQNYMFERFLERLSVSEYSENVNTDTLVKICGTLDCTFDEIMEIVPDADEEK